MVAMEDVVGVIDARTLFSLLCVQHDWSNMRKIKERTEDLFVLGGRDRNVQVCATFIIHQPQIFNPGALIHHRHPRILTLILCWYAGCACLCFCLFTLIDSRWPWEKFADGRWREWSCSIVRARQWRKQTNSLHGRLKETRPEHWREMWSRAGLLQPPLPGPKRGFYTHFFIRAPDERSPYTLTIARPGACPICAKPSSKQINKRGKRKRKTIGRWCWLDMLDECPGGNKNISLRLD